MNTNSTQAEVREEEPLKSSAGTPLHAIKRHWISVVVITLLGGLLGAAVGFLIKPTYTAESRVAVGAGNLSSGAIAGFPLAAAQLASNYARYVNDNGIAGNNVPEGATVGASQIPESNVIRIEAKSTDEQAAVTAAQTTAQELINRVNGSSNGQDNPSDTQSQLDKAADAWGRTQTEMSAAEVELARARNTPGASAAQIAAAQQALAKAKSEDAKAQARRDSLSQKLIREVSEGSQAADLVLVRDSSVSGSDRSGRIQRFAMIGIIAGLGIATLAVVLGDRKRSGGTQRRARV